jgi:hypothetical protein
MPDGKLLIQPTRIIESRRARLLVQLFRRNLLADSRFSCHARNLASPLALDQKCGYTAFLLLTGAKALRPTREAKKLKTG